MKRRILTLFALLPLLAIGEVFTERSFTVCGTGFVFEFEDDSISHTNKLRIADDVITSRSCWTNSEIRLKPTRGFDGDIYDWNVPISPYAGKDIDFPAFFNIHGTNRCLFISRDLSCAYTNAFAFVDANTNMYESAMRFVDLMVSGNYERVPSNEFYKVVYWKNIPRSEYAGNRDEIILDLKCQTFVHPSILGIYSTGPEANDFPFEAKWIRLPTFSRPYYSQHDTFDLVHIFWHEDMWRIYLTE